jgi:putative membrane protein
MRFFARMVLNGLAIVIAAWIVPGLQLTGILPALVAGAILGVVNALVRPVLFILTLPLTLVTLGFFIFVINALCLALTAAIVPGFEIGGVWAAFFGALLVSIVSWILNGVFASDLPAERRGEW